MEGTFELESGTDTITEESRSRSGSISRYANYRNLGAEKVLEGFGTLGAYQTFVYAMINTGYFLCAYQTRIFALVVEKPEFTCNKPEQFNVTSDQCEYFDSEMNSIIKCSNFSYTKGRHSYLTSEFDLVCEDAHYGEYILSLYMMGSMLFTPILTQLADLHGRRMIFLISVWLIVLANIGCAFTPNHKLFMGFVFIAAVGNSGVRTVGYILMLETITLTCRSHFPLISATVWVAGYTTVGIVHMYIESWRWQLFALIAPFILTFSYYWLLPESLHWLITYNKTKKVERWIKNAEKFGNKKLDLEKCKNSDEGDSRKHGHKRTFVDIISNGPMVFQLLSHCYIMSVMNFTYWALSIFATDLHENKMMGYFFSGFAELPAAGTAFLLTRFGRRTVTSFSLLAQAVAMCIATFYPGRNLISMTLFLLVKSFNSFSWITEPLLLGEMAPTSTRNTFFGVPLFVGAIGSIFAPYFNRLKTIHEIAPAITMALVSLIAGLLTLCSPETANVPMPEDIDDFNPGPVYYWIFGKPRTRTKAISTEQSSTLLLEHP